MKIKRECEGKVMIMKNRREEDPGDHRGEAGIAEGWRMNGWGGIWKGREGEGRGRTES